MSIRLNRFLAHSGLGSRRAVEQLILDGVVTVNGKAVRDLATQIGDADQVLVNGRSVQPARQFEYVMLNKPRGYDVTRGGEHHHRRAYDLLPPETHASVQSVGRLDRDSTGLLIFTNDGDLAFRLSHPRYGCRKIYEAEVEGRVHISTIDQLREGVLLEDGPAQAAQAELLYCEVAGQSRLRITMEEGRNRIVRRMCEAVGHPVISLDRIGFGPLVLGVLARGKTRPLNKREIAGLRRAVGLPTEESEAPKPRGRATGPRTTGGPRPTGSRPSQGGRTSQSGDRRPQRDSRDDARPAHQGGRSQRNPRAEAEARAQEARPQDSRPPRGPRSGDTRPDRAPGRPDRPTSRPPSRPESGGRSDRPIRSDQRSGQRPAPWAASSRDERATPDAPGRAPKASFRPRKSHANRPRPAEGPPSQESLDKNSRLTPFKKFIKKKSK